MVNAQEWLDKNYPKEIRNSINNLHIKEKELEGQLDLSDFVKLERLDCSYNNLTNLTLRKITDLIYINCEDNQLTNFDFLSFLNPERLSWVYISNNNIPQQDLSCFQYFVNLEELGINDNRFYGSLKPLRNLYKLNQIYINNTDINSGVEWLPVNIKQIHHSTTRPESKIKEITEELVSFLEKRKEKNNWKDIHPEFNEEIQGEWEQLDFSYQQAKEWIEAGLQIDDYFFAIYLKGRGGSPKQALNWEELKKEKRFAQYLLNKDYPLKEREWVTWIDISRNGLEGELVIENFSGLERLDCWRNQITSLTLKNLPKLAYLSARDSKLTNLFISDCSKIDWIDVKGNFLNDLDFLTSLTPDRLVYLSIINNNFPPQDVNIFSKFVNLKELHLTGNQFYGKLQSLRSLSKLWHFTFAGNEIEGGLEDLPNNLMEVTLFPQDLELSETSSIKLVGLTSPLRKEKKLIDNPYYDFQYWKEAQPYFKWLKEQLEKVNPNLNINELLKNIFFNVRTGSFEGNLQGLTYLLQLNKTLTDEKEKEIVELIIFIRKQKEKIIQAYLYFSPNKEKLREFINNYLGLIKAIKKTLPVFKLRKQHNELYNELGEEFGENLMEREVEVIMKECKKLVSLELQLEKGTTKRKKFIEDIYKKMISVNISIGNSNFEAKGNVIIGNVFFGDNIDLSYKKLIELPVEVETKIEIPPK